MRRRRIVNHGAELQNRESLTVPTNTFLKEEDRPFRGEANQNCSQQEERSNYRQGGKNADAVKDTLGS